MNSCPFVCLFLGDYFSFVACLFFVCLFFLFFFLGFVLLFFCVGGIQHMYIVISVFFMMLMLMLHTIA